MPGLEASRYAPSSSRHDSASRLDDAENLNSFLHRARFHMDPLKINPVSSPSLGPTQSATSTAQNEQNWTQGETLAEVGNAQQPPSMLSDSDRRRLFQQAVHQVAAVGANSEATPTLTVPERTSLAIRGGDMRAGSNGFVPSPAMHTSNDLPISALSYTLRSSSLQTSNGGSSTTPHTVPHTVVTSPSSYDRQSSDFLAKQKSIAARIAELKAKRAAGDKVPFPLPSTDTQRQEAEGRDIARQAAAREAAERKEATQRKEADERKEAAERKEAERKEAGRKEAEQREAQRKEDERLEMERQEAQHQEAQRKALKRKDDELKDLRAAIQTLENNDVERQKEHNAKLANIQTTILGAKEYLASIVELRESVDLDYKEKCTELEKEKVDAEQQLAKAGQDLSDLQLTAQDAQKQAQADRDLLEKELGKLTAAITGPMSNPGAISESSVPAQGEQATNGTSPSLVNGAVNSNPMTAVTNGAQKVASRGYLPANIEEASARRIMEYIKKQGENAMKVGDKWISPDDKSKTPAFVRRVKLTNLPPGTTIEVVHALVWGGKIDQFVYTEGESTAQVLFLKFNKCIDYFNATSRGIAYSGRTVRVELSPLAEPVHDFLKDCSRAKATRAISFIGLGSEWTNTSLSELARGNGRKIERCLTGKHKSGVRMAVIRFFGMLEAIDFYYTITKTAQFHGCEIFFSDDPCEKAEKPHFALR